MKMHIVHAETGERLGTVSTKYNSISTLFENFMQWNRRRNNAYVYGKLERGSDSRPALLYVKEAN